MHAPDAITRSRSASSSVSAPQDPTRTIGLHVVLAEQLVDVDRQRGQAHPGALHRDPLAAVGAGEAEHAADLGVAPRVLEERLGDPLGPQRVAGQQDVGRDLAGLGADVGAHAPHRRVGTVTYPQFPAPGSTDIALSVRTHDRVGERRTDDGWLAETWADPATRIVPVAGNRFPVDEAGGTVRWQAPPTLPADGPADVPRDARTTSRTSRWWSTSPPTTGRWTDVPGGGRRRCRSRTPGSWCTRSRSRSGTRRTGSARAAASRAGRRRPRATCCAATENGHQQFPRTDPAVIMMVTDGDRALLGRQAAWPEGRYSTLAGFVDPGESLEEAVIREVRRGDRRARQRRRPTSATSRGRSRRA